MRGTSWMRHQGGRDALLNRVVGEHGFDDAPNYARQFPGWVEAERRWEELVPLRDGPVNPVAAAAGDPSASARDIKALALDLGADIVGIAVLKPEFVKLGVDIAHDFVIAMGVHEAYGKVLGGADAVCAEAFDVYRRCAEIATDLARHIREELGFEAVAHHNGACEIQTIPAMIAAGFGEMGKNGSLINAEFGANFRPGMVSTTLPLAADGPKDMGVQDTCMTCNLCTNNCPGDAIAAEPIVTDGIKRWLVDIAKCYPISRLRPEYCHLCVDVCPYIHKLNGNSDYREIFKTFLRQRKDAGFKAQIPRRRRWMTMPILSARWRWRRCACWRKAMAASRSRLRAEALPATFPPGSPNPI